MLYLRSGPVKNGEELVYLLTIRGEGVSVKVLGSCCCING